MHQRSWPSSRDVAVTLATLLVTIALTGCGGDSTAPLLVAPTIAASAGDAQSGTVATQLAVSPSVVITDKYGRKAAGVAVEFGIASGGGSVALASAVTNSSGIASAGTWTLGKTAGTQTLTATAAVDSASLAVTFSATAAPDVPAAISIGSSGPLGGPYGATLAAPIRAIVNDKYGNAVSGVTVSFAIDSGAVLASSGVTDANGVASTRVRLPQTIGTASFTAAVTNGPRTTVPFASTGIAFASFSLDNVTTCGLSVEGYGYCWGVRGDAVDGTQLAVPSPAPIRGGYSFKSISIAGGGGCGIIADQSAVCWGNNSFGQDGLGGAVPDFSTHAPAPVVGGLRFSAISRGQYTTCGIATTGTTYCWGSNITAQLGTKSVPIGPSANGVASPTAVNTAQAFTAVAVGQYHACALTSAGQAYCWGTAQDGRAGATVGDSPCAPVTAGCVSAPLAVNTTLRFTSLVAGLESTCGLATDGGTYCWGSNMLGELGTGDTLSSATPRHVASPVDFAQIASSGSGRGVCGLTATGDVYCWGFLVSAVNVFPRTCPANTDCTVTPSLPYNAMQKFSSIAAIEGRACGLSAGVAYCWGLDYNGELGAPQPVINPQLPHAISNQQ